MCRLLVMAATPPAHPDPKRDPARYKRGDVVRIAEDGESLGRDSKINPIWRIIELPGISGVDKDLLPLLVRDGGGTDIPFTTDLGYRTHKRAKNIDIDSFESWATGQKGSPLIDNEKLVVTNDIDIQTQITDKIITKVPVPSSLVIG